MKHSILASYPSDEFVMLARKTTKNRITIPKAIVTRFTGADYFDVSTDGVCIVLRPLSAADKIRAQLADLGIDETNVTASISWARRTKASP
jgi:hypothetical protein